MNSTSQRERVAISGLDAAAAAVVVSLVTGATLPDEGIVTVFGKSTADIRDGDEWLASLDRFGIVSPRAVLLEDATLQQNLAMPFTLQIEPVPGTSWNRVAALAAECGLAAELADRAGRKFDAARCARGCISRARVALAPKLLILEHPDRGHVRKRARRAFGARRRAPWRRRAASAAGDYV